MTRPPWAVGPVLLPALLAAVPAQAQCPDGTPPPCARPALRAPAPNSVAVLYFNNLSRDTSDILLADGLTEELIIRLSQVRRLEVKSRFESLHFRGQRASDPRGLGRALHVAYLVTGSLQSAGNRVRLRVALVRTLDGTQRWGEVYDRTGGDILALQSEVAREVAGAITGQLLPEERATLARRPTRDPAAYQLYLRGLGASNAIAEQSWRAGLEYLDRAIARDSGFAAAYAQRAVIWWLLADGFEEGRVGYARVRENAEEAIRRDSSLAIAYAMLSQSALALDADVPRATELAERAARLAPGSALAHVVLSQVLLVSGSLNDSAVAEARRAWETDTLSAHAAAELLFALYSTGRLDSLEATLPRVRGAAADVAHQYEGIVLLAHHDAVAAIRHLSPALMNGVFAAEYVQALADAGRPQAAGLVVDSMVLVAERRYVSAYAIARACAALGRSDDAFSWLDRAWGQRTIMVAYARVDRALASLHADPRWAAFLRRMGLTP